MTQMPHRAARELIACRVADAEQRRIEGRGAGARRRRSAEPESPARHCGTYESLGGT
ncbi:MAG TPA: hypothetical protein VGK78_09810 [Nocardioides sp.]|uniref:hypothetical protein n=1 Tax=Nocardioides sp. TaxID=35761 RepID=UPI002F401FBF